MISEIDVAVTTVAFSTDEYLVNRISTAGFRSIKFNDSGKRLASRELNEMLHDVDAAIKIIAGTARSMGIEVKGLDSNSNTPKQEIANPTTNKNEDPSDNQAIQSADNQSEDVVQNDNEINNLVDSDKEDSSVNDSGGSDEGK